MDNWQDRTELLIGKENTEKLKRAHVLAVGLGGVGGIAAEMLCRAGIGSMTIVDGDKVDVTNLNRQIPALHSTLGQYKTEAVGKRLLDINPELNLRIETLFLEESNIPELLESARFDCVLDAIDTLAPKIFLAKTCYEKHIPIVCCMGAGARENPEKVITADLSKTFGCPLAKAFRHGLAELGIRKGIPSVFSTEMPIRSAIRRDESMRNKKSTTGTISFMPAVFGCHCTAAVIKQLLKIQSL